MLDNKYIYLGKEHIVPFYFYLYRPTSPFESCQIEKGGNEKRQFANDGLTTGKHHK